MFRKDSRKGLPYRGERVTEPQKLPEDQLIGGITCRYLGLGAPDPDLLVGRKSGCHILS